MTQEALKLALDFVETVHVGEWVGSIERQLEVITAIKEALAQEQEPVAWQPIVTAPKETEVFIGAFIDGVFKFGRSEMFYEQANEFAGETWSGWVWSVDDCDNSVAEMPTHWMPLPSEPIEAAHGIKGDT